MISAYSPDEWMLLEPYNYFEIDKLMFVGLVSTPLIFGGSFL